MFKVVWKSFRYNRKNFLSFFTSEILSVTVIFMLIYIQEALSQVPGIKTEALQFAYQSELRKQLRIIIPCIILIMITAHLCNTVRSKQYEHESSIGDIRSLFRRIYK